MYGSHMNIVNTVILAISGTVTWTRRHGKTTTFHLAHPSPFHGGSTGVQALGYKSLVRVANEPNIDVTSALVTFKGAFADFVGFFVLPS
jgi:hypothetical protein